MAGCRYKINHIPGYNLLWYRKNFTASGEKRLHGPKDAR